MNERIKAGSDIHAGDGGYGIGTKENYDAFVKVRNKSLAAARIKELEKQSTTVVEGWSDENGTTRYYEFDRKKFAELIVKECMGVCGQVAEDAHKQKESSFLTSDGKQLYNGVWGGAMNCGARIANHFGIEV